MKDFNNFKSNLKFTFEHHRNFIDFLELSVKFYDVELTTSVYLKPTYCYQYYHYRSYHPDILNGQLFIVNFMGRLLMFI